MWIEVVIRPEQCGLLDQFFARFPDRMLAVRETNGTLYYTAHTCEGAAGVPQINFLHAHKLAYINLENERVQVIKDIFSGGVEVDGMRVTEVFFPGMAENRLKVILKSEEGDTIVVRFPCDWRLPVKNWCAQTGLCHMQKVASRQEEETS
jgi:hypothetical protein